MTARYELELDTPIPELTELGWSRMRLFRDIDPEKSPEQLGLMLEPSTGTLMLRPCCFEPEWTYDPAVESHKLQAAVLTYNATMWEEVPYGGALAATPFDNWVQTKHGFDLIDGLVIAALPNIVMSASRTMKPILASTETFAANAGVRLSYVCYGKHGLYNKDYLGVMFGDFYLNLHANGNAELWWSTDGSRDEDSWVLRKTFAMTGAQRKKGTAMVTGVGIGPQQVIAVTIIPMGRGHIYVRINTPWGGHFEGVYTHPEATVAGGVYSITAAGKVVVYTNVVDQKQVRVQLAHVVYPAAATWLDVAWQMPYTPTVEPGSVIWNSKTSSGVSVTGRLLDENGVVYVADGTHATIQPEITLTPSTDNLFTPFVDGYGIVVPRAVETQARTPIKIEGDELISLEVEDGEDWDDQRITAVAQNVEGGLDWLEERSEIVGRLLIDDVSYGVYAFAKPKIALGKQRNLITLSGINYGVARVTEKRFRFAPTYGGKTHPTVVTEVLSHCGFPTITATADTVTLPESIDKGTDNDTAETELRSQPQFGESAREFLEYVTAEFSRWPLRYKGDQTWVYAPRTVPATPSLTFYKESTSVNPTDRLPYAYEPTKEIIPPECNMLYVYGQDEAGQPIATYAFDDDSYDGDPKPTNYLGRWKTVDIVDPALNTDAILAQVRDTMFAELSERIVLVEWDGPFIPTLEIWDRVTVEGVGDVLVTGISASANHPRSLEQGRSTHYSGELIE